MLELNEDSPKVKYGKVLLTNPIACNVFHHGRMLDISENEILGRN